MFLSKEEIIQGTKEILQDRSFYRGKLVFNIKLPVEIYGEELKEEKLSKMIEFFKKEYSLNLNFIQAFFYFISELSINVPEHAKAKKAFLKVFELGNKEFLEILIKDDGIGIKNSLLQNKIFIKDDIDAFKEVFRGVSAKKEKTRGFGLRTSKDIVTKAFGGNFLLFSGQETFLSEQNKEIFRPIFGKLKGTAIDCLVPLSKKKINIYEFIE
ncbi:ATP-binding protein [Patescibacteria group bacterium]|nr:ATP-binding protein [Patescibacteria group bacterium]MBU4078012.1 ATP-binding protein [Patescibacteria group bacterium]